MTDDKNAPSANEKGKQNSNTNDKEDNTSQNGWQTLTNNQFKSPEDLAKSYKELEKKFGEQSDEVRQAREFTEIVKPVLEEIRNDPEIFEKLDEKLRSKNSPVKETNNKKTTTVKEEETEEVRDVARELVMERFESKIGLKNLSKEDQKQVREQIGQAIIDNTGSNFNQISLKRLSTVLDNAYTLAKAKMGEQEVKKLDALISASGEGAISTIPSSGGKAESTLSSEEAKIADKLGLSREQYLKGKKK